MTVLLPRVYQEQVKRVKRERLGPERWCEPWGPRTPENMERVARNILSVEKVYEWPERSKFNQVRELVALWLAPWLRCTESPSWRIRRSF